MDFETITYPLPLEKDHYLHYGAMIHCSRLLEQKATVAHAPENEFLGLYFNLQNTLHFRTETPPNGIIRRNQFSLVYAPAKCCEITLLKGRYTSFCVGLSPETLTLFVDRFPSLRSFGDAVKEKKPAIVTGGPFPITFEQRSIIDEILTNRFTGSARNMFLQAKFLGLMILSFELIAKHHNNGLDKSEIEKIRQAHAHILRDVRYNHNVEMLADKVGLKKRTLGSGFAMLYGTTIQNFVADERMKKAHKLLEETTLSVGEVAAILGYERITSFSDMFRHKFGYTPREVRKGHHE